MVNLEPKLTNPLREIWLNEKFKIFCSYKPVAPSYILQNCILFVGINPSKSKDEPIFNDTNEVSKVKYYSLTQESGHQYFNKFVDISKRINLKWTHFDLLFFQETNQNFIKYILQQPNGKEYIAKQLLLSKEIFMLCDPKIIIVNNSMARDFMINEMKIEFIWNEELGTETYNNIPVFFTSMLTGQRALDKGSYSRLIWHIKYVLKKI